MPVINVTTSKELTLDQMEKIRVAITEEICKIPGKRAKATMVIFADKMHMYFGDKKHDACAFVQISAYGEVAMENKKEITEKISQHLEDLAEIQKTDIFLNFSEYANWGAGGSLK